MDPLINCPSSQKRLRDLIRAPLIITDIEVWTVIQPVVRPGPDCRVNDSSYSYEALNVKLKMKTHITEKVAPSIRF